MNGPRIASLADFEDYRLRGTLAPDDRAVTLSLFSHIHGNLWLGGCPVEAVPKDFDYVAAVHTANDYHVQRHQVIVRANLQDHAQLPDLNQLHVLARFVVNSMACGKTLVHCRAGLNRSGLVAGLALVMSGWTPGAAIALMRERRSPEVLHNTVFERWLRQQFEIAAAAPSAAQTVARPHEGST